MPSIREQELAMRDYREIVLWKDVKADIWCDWHWQMQNVITTVDELDKVIELSPEERMGTETATRLLKMRISPHICTLMDPHNPADPLRRQFVPLHREVSSIDDEELFLDVNADERYSPLKGLVHRYPTKVLLFPSNYCGSYCRYCFRRKLVREVEETLSKRMLTDIFEYIKADRQIEEVILSGGDPLVLSDGALEHILEGLSRIPHVQITRLHTRLPVTIPYRITHKFVSMLSRYKPVYMVIHIDSVHEISTAMREAVGKLVDSGIPCLASCPLLRGVNDSEEALRTLWTELVKMRVKPYYLFHSDPVKGLRHFLVPISRGLEIMRNLYDRMSGLAMPHYCFNVPDGGGHVLLNYNYVKELGQGHYLITTFEGDQLEYIEPIES